MKRVAVVGGGISGLSAAYFLQEKARGSREPIEVVLLESDYRLGGSIYTEKADGFLLEGGPDCFLSEKPWALKLCQRLGIEDDLLNTNENRRTFILSRGRLHQLPEGFMLLVPTDIMPFVRSTLISPLGKVRMAMDLVIPKKKTDEEESLAQFVLRRLGQEALEKIAEPLVAGIHASVPETMSLKATFPRFIELEQAHGSLIRGMMERRKKFRQFMKNYKGPRRTLFVTLKSGLGTLVDALQARLNPGSILVEKEVAGLEKMNQNGELSYRLEFRSGETLDVDALVLATPSFVSGNLLGSLDLPLKALLHTIPYVSSAIVQLAYRKSEIHHPLDGFGFVVPRTANRDIMASTWTSVKFAHRAPDDKVLLRVFVGGAKNAAAMALDDEGMVAMARRELSDIMGIEATPVLTRVYRWESSMPQYTVGHMDRIAEIEARVARNPGVFLIGCAYRGVGLSDCIHEGQLVTEKILGYLKNSGAERK